jgi:hypothetical protein
MFKPLLCISLLMFSSLTPAVEMPASVESSHSLDLQRQLASSEFETLKAGDATFTTLYKPAMTAFTKGTVILLPDWSQHAASPRGIDMLRQQLVDYGWNTLAVMVPDPVPQPDAENLLTYQNELLLRLQAAMEKAQSKTGSVIVVAQGSSGAILNQLYQSSDVAKPDGLVLLSAYLAEPALNDAVSLALAKHKVPTLDIQQQNDNAFVLASSTLRLQLVRKHIKELYRQRILPGSMDDRHNQQWLFSEINGWLSYLGY